MRLRSIIGLAIVLAIGSAVWFHLSLQPRNVNDAVRQIVDIPKGQSLKQIADLLEEKGIVKSSLAFRLYVQWKGMADKLQAGQVIVAPSFTVTDVLAALGNGIARELSITIPEGFTVADIDALLAERKLLKPGEFTACAQTCDVSSFGFLPQRKDLAVRGGKVEGYLFPDTYFVLADSFTAKAFLERLLQTFESRVVKGLERETMASGRALQEIVTMASLVEEETRTDDERPVVAGILWKRFDQGMRLDVDAGLRYALQKPSSAITVQDLQSGSPYNLRKAGGLPPGPIASPSVASFRATITPKPSVYWYYLHGSDGVIRYAQTNDEHNENKMRFLR